MPRMSARRSTRPLAVLAALAALSLSLAGCGDDSDSGSDDPQSSTPASASSSGAADGACDYAENGEAAKKVDPPPAEPTVSGTVPVSIETSVGTLKANLDAAAAPCTVGSFVSLAEQGYYDGTTCHRLTTAGIYVLQCGDAAAKRDTPAENGRTGPGYTVPDEYTGEESYPAGTLAMANTGMPNSGGSQFFIVYRDSSENLASTYTVFGSLDKASTETVQEVAAAGADDSNGPGDGLPKTPVDITAVIAG